MRSIKRFYFKLKRAITYFIFGWNSVDYDYSSIEKYLLFKLKRIKYNIEKIDPVKRVVAIDWQPHYFDYLFLALTTSSAFSPTDTFPLTWRAKLLTGIQATVSLVVIALVAARAVNILK